MSEYTYYYKDFDWLDLEKRPFGDIAVIGQLLRALSARLYPISALDVFENGYDDYRAQFLEEDESVALIDSSPNSGSSWEAMDWGPRDEDFFPANMTTHGSTSVLLGFAIQMLDQYAYESFAGSNYYIVPSDEHPYEPLLLPTEVHAMYTYHRVSDILNTYFSSPFPGSINARVPQYNPSNFIRIVNLLRWCYDAQTTLSDYLLISAYIEVYVSVYWRLGEEIHQDTFLDGNGIIDPHSPAFIWDVPADPTIPALGSESMTCKYFTNYPTTLFLKMEAIPLGSALFGEEDNPEMFKSFGVTVDYYNLDTFVSRFTDITVDAFAPREEPIQIAGVFMESTTRLLVTVTDLNPDYRHDTLWLRGAIRIWPSGWGEE